MIGREIKEHLSPPKKNPERIGMTFLPGCGAPVNRLARSATGVKKRSCFGGKGWACGSVMYVSDCTWSCNPIVKKYGMAPREGGGGGEMTAVVVAKRVGSGDVSKKEVQR